VGEQDLGDMDGAAFRAAAQRLLEWTADYLHESDRYPVLSRIEPGGIASSLPDAAPAAGESMDTILDDFQRVLFPGLTHWNHPGFLAYFATSGSGPGVLAEFLTAAVNQQAMLWQTSPAATELEHVVLGWLRQLLGLPDAFEGVIYDGGSASNFPALAAAVTRAVPDASSRGLVGRPDVPALCVYTSEQAHSSVDKAMMLLGLGHRALRKVPVDDAFRMRAADLKAAITADRDAGCLPVAVVATAGTTSTSSVDPVNAIADICQRDRIWLHVDASYGGAAAMVPDHAWVFDGVPRADSVVVNPHKWMFTPLDLSAFYCRRFDTARSAFALTPDYLQTEQGPQVRNLMDTGLSLGRRFRALKLWMVLRFFGADGLRARIADHIRLARMFAAWIDEHPDFERLAPVPLSVVCFRAVPRHPTLDASALDALNADLLAAVNASGEVFLSHTRLHGRYALRVAVGHIRTHDRHVERAWQVIGEALEQWRARPTLMSVGREPTGT
jgi:aromatic-L-amino-acid/L-tryptophan decarboxylase